MASSGYDPQPGGRRGSVTRGAPDATLVIVQPGSRAGDERGDASGGRRSPAGPALMGESSGRRSPANGRASPASGSPGASREQRRRRRRRGAGQRRTASEEEDEFEGDSCDDGGGGAPPPSESAEYYAGIDEASSARLEAEAAGGVHPAAQGRGDDEEEDDGAYHDAGGSGAYDDANEIATSATRRITWSDEHGIALVEVRGAGARTQQRIPHRLSAPVTPRADILLGPPALLRPL